MSIFGNSEAEIARQYDVCDNEGSSWWTSMIDLLWWWRRQYY